MGGLGGQLGELATSIAGPIAAGISLVEGFKLVREEIGKDIEEAAAEETIMTQLAATIQSTGRSAATSAEGVQDMAMKLQGLFSHDDIEKATNELMRYMDIPSDKIPEDIALVDNMAAAMGTDMATAADRYGQAMETGRVRGFGFSKQTTEQISNLMSLGKITEADAIIQDNLNQKYAGQSAAAMDTYAGKQKMVKTMFSDLREEIGNKFLPVAKAIDDWLIRIGKNSGDLPKSIEDMNSDLQYYLKLKNDMIASGTAQDDPSLEAVQTQIDSLQYGIDEANNAAQGFTTTITVVGDTTAAAAPQLDVFTRAVIDSEGALKQEQDEFSYIVKFAEGYDKAKQKVLDTEKKSQESIDKYNQSLIYYENLQKNGPAIIEAMENKLETLKNTVGEGSDAYKKANDQLKLTKAGYADAGGIIDTLNGKLDEETAKVDEAKKAQADATNEMIADFMQQRLTMDADGFTEKDMMKVLEFKRNMGLLSSEGFGAALLSLQQMDAMINGIPSDIPVTISISMTGQDNADAWIASHGGGGGSGGSGGGGGSNPPPKAKHIIGIDPNTHQPIYGFASGGSVVAPPGYDNDNYPVMISSGEQAIVIPARDVARASGSRSADGGDGGAVLQNYGTINIYLSGERANVAQFMKELGVAM
jgi:hypothetical protein